MFTYVGNDYNEDVTSKEDHESATDDHLFLVFLFYNVLIIVITYCSVLYMKTKTTKIYIELLLIFLVSL